MIEAASSYPSELVGSLVVGARDAEVTVSLLAGPDQAATEQTLNSFLNCCTDLSRVGRFLLVYVGASALDRAGLRERAKLRKRYGFLEFVDCGPGAGPGAHLAQIREQIGGRFWLHLGQGWQFIAPANLITGLIAVLEAEAKVFQVGINYGAAKLTNTCAAEQAVRRAPGAGRYVLTDDVISGPAMFDTARLDRAGGVDGTHPDPVGALGRRATAAGLRTATLHAVLCQESSASTPAIPLEVSGPKASATRLILAGHSHLQAIAGKHISCFSGPLRVTGSTRGDGTLILAGPWPRDMTYWNTVADLGMGANVGIVWNGNEHNACYFFEGDTPFDFLSTHVRKMNPSAQIVSKAAIRHRFQQISFNNLDLALKRLATGGLNRLALIGTPPPKDDNEALRVLLEKESFFVKKAALLGQSVETVPITDPYVRLKLWYLLQDMLAEEARIRGLLFIPAPKEVQDANGFLKREFWASDVSHANEAYGNVIYETVVQALR